MKLSGHEILKIDREHLWHPYASMKCPVTPFPVESASGVRLRLSDGRELIDGMSSWWTAIHGYNHPVLNLAAEEQLKSMSHVMFGGLTHGPAAGLASLLLELVPAPLDKIFFSDSGSVAVEVAMKLAVQYWHSLGKPEKKRFLALRSGYHGDTAGAMSVCDPVTGMHGLFSDMVQENYFAEAPQCRFDASWDDSYIAGFRKLLVEHDDIAAVIMEPVMQGAGGMRFYSPEYLVKARELCDEHGVLLIFDEIATGFWRTGKLFAFHHPKSTIVPDILCLGKAMTGGYVSLAATITTENISDAISESAPRAFMHGPTFMANPLACSISAASIRLLGTYPMEDIILKLEGALRRFLAPALRLPNVADVRVLGGVGVIETRRPVDMESMTMRLACKGVWLRPFGRLVYTMPPYVIAGSDLERLAVSMVEAVEEEG